MLDKLHVIRTTFGKKLSAFFIHDKFKPNRFDIGLSRAPAPTPKFYRHKIAVALCGLYLV
ncbi:hypothetical protein [Ruminococcus sp.]|uniref:hypothetical protein n=1 Tax=Ruminococcus sp. TaxID=41978 RepID=UPI00257BC829|nr:hypothetical protein [Ruminococcus sp.]